MKTQSGDIVVKGAKVIEGDCVLLSCSVSAEIMSIQDFDGCQIRFDGVVKSIEDGCCRVLVMVEARGRPISVLLKTKLKDVELTGSVNVWGIRTARAIDRKRKTGTDECEFWAPL